MAKTSAVYGQSHSQRTGATRLNDAPPSTLAANLVNNIPSLRRTSRNDDPEDFQRLLLELSEDADNAGQDRDQEARVKHNHKLIYVVVKAVLGLLIVESPFATASQRLQQIQQGSEALDILIVAITETPEVLAYASEDDDGLRGASHTPLWLWLFPRLLVLLGRPQCDTLNAKLDEVFGICFKVDSTSADLWNLATAFFHYFRSCMEGTQIYLQESTAILQDTNQLLKLTLPPSTLAGDVGLPVGLDLHQEGCTYTITNLGYAVGHMSAVLSLLVRLCVSSFRSYSAAPSATSYVAWLLDALNAIPQICRLNVHSATSSPSSSIVLFLCLSATLSLCDVLQDQMQGQSLRKCYLVLATLLLEIISEAQQEDHALHSHELCLAVQALLVGCKDDAVLYDFLQQVLLLHLVEFQTVIGAESAVNSHLTYLIAYLREAPFVKDRKSSLRAEDPASLHSCHDSISSPKQDDQRPAKRQKVHADQSLLRNISNEVYQLLGAQEAFDIDGLCQIASSSFPTLTEPKRCSALAALRHILCASAGTLTVLHDENNITASMTCSVCDSSEKQSSHKVVAEMHVAEETIKTLTSLISLREFEESRKSRVYAMLAIKSLICHSTDEEFLDLERSLLGQWCLRSLKSSIRELRILAGRVLPYFMTQLVEERVRASNIKNTVGIMRDLSENSPDHVAETCVMAWGQIGRVVAGDELNLVLLRLVDYLGHNNQIVSGTAFNRLLSTADVHGMTLLQLFRPFWRSIAPMAVKDLQVRPQSTQLMADLLAISVSEFLILTQAFTLPWLVAMKKKDIIMRISQARGDPELDDPWRLCLENTNLAALVAFLLVQNVPDTEAFVLTSLGELSPHIKKNLDFYSILRTEPVGIAYELLKSAGEEDESKKSRVRYALQFLANRICTPTADAHNGKRGNQLGQFFEQYILAIMAHFSDLVNDNRGWRSLIEKLRALHGIEELLRVGRNHIRSALPQICASLQTALVQQDLCDAAFAAWITLVKSLDDDDVKTILPTTFSIVISRWASFDDRSRTAATELLDYLLSKRSSVLHSSLEIIPSFAGIPALSKYRQILDKLKGAVEVRQNYDIFSDRILHEHEAVVAQAMVELIEYLRKQQAFLQASAVSEQPDPVISRLLRALLDACVKFNGNSDIARLSAECIGLIGCLDSNRIEAVRDRKDMVVISNFEEAADTTDFVLFILEHVLVKAFLSANNPKSQGFLSFTMQELLEKCDLTNTIANRRKPGDHAVNEEMYQKWCTLPEAVRTTLTPFLKSRYVVTEMLKSQTQYPIYQSDKKYAVWLRSFVLDLLEQPRNQNALLIFAPLCRVIRIQELSIASFLLPYVVLHAVVLGTDEQRSNITNELFRVLSHQVAEKSHHELMHLKLCSEAVFRVLDYMSRWAQEREAGLNATKGYDSRWTNPDDDNLPLDTGIQRINSLISTIPAEVISKRAVECKSYARALFHWEQHIREMKESAKKGLDTTLYLQRLQDIYAQIDEPDGIEGISAHLHVLDLDQQILGHQKAGRWTTAQSWYEIQLVEQPDNVEVQTSLLHCLRESGQHDVLLNYVESMQKTNSSISRLLPFATEASWTTNRWDALQKYLTDTAVEIGSDFDVDVGRLLVSLHANDEGSFMRDLKTVREQVANSLSTTNTDSLGACHDARLRMHVLTEIEMISSVETRGTSRQDVLMNLDRRLEAVGSYLGDKQYILGIRRAAMQLSSPGFTRADVASAWLTSARLARKGNSMQQSFNAVLHASQLGDASATIEHARLLWKEGQSRKAIQSLQGAIETNAFMSRNRGPLDGETSYTGDGPKEQNMLSARAHLLLAKWLDDAGQTQSSALQSQYQLPAKLFSKWEKGHYYLGRHYNKLLEAEKHLAIDQQSDKYLTGETAKLVIENYFRSLTYGTKYIYQTLPRILTLWLDLGSRVTQSVDAKYGTKEFVQKLTDRRKELLALLHTKFKKYIQKMPAYMFYTALPQIVARIAHNNGEVYKLIQQIIVKVVSSYPQQALWSLLAVSTSTQPERKTRGTIILQTLRGLTTKDHTGHVDLKTMIKSGERLSDQLLMVCNAGEFQGNRTVTASITRELGFNHKSCIPSPLAVPIEKALTATLPTLTDNVLSHKAFSRDVITISGFRDEVLVLSSLQKPRKLTARGSDGQNYGLLCKPKDDLRKDQRLMEFNSMINRSLKRDAESSKRQLYIKTYAVTPLNEECGIIEWIDGLKTLRDILLSLYKARGMSPNYGEIKVYLDEANKSEDKLPFFTQKILGDYPPVFHHWFVSQFPDPSSWFLARLKYTRSCAVMSMVGTILGLGDRHGENILFEQSNGGTFHVDFNCLFDKGLTFAQPERVPFRLTHNMVDAMGVYGYEGPFRKSAELTLKLLRLNEETLMTILEAFVYDPTLDLLAKKNKLKSRERELSGPAETPQGVLDAIRRKVRGLLAGESVPLGVEGQVDVLIKQAVDSKNLAAMYIGWCAFF